MVILMDLAVAGLCETSKPLTQLARTALNGPSSIVQLTAARSPNLTDAAHCSNVWFQGVLLTSRSKAPYAETMMKPFFSVNSYYPQLR